MIDSVAGIRTLFGLSWYAQNQNTFRSEADFIWLLSPSPKRFNLESIYVTTSDDNADLNMAETTITFRTACEKLVGYKKISDKAKIFVHNGKPYFFGTFQDFLVIWRSVILLTKIKKEDGFLNLESDDKMFSDIVFRVIRENAEEIKTFKQNLAKKPYDEVFDVICST